MAQSIEVEETLLKYNLHTCKRESHFLFQYLQIERKNNMDFSGTEEQLRALCSAHRNLKEYRLGRTVQLILSSLLRLRRRAATLGCNSQAYFARVEGLRSMVKKQDAAFNLLVHDSSFTQKRSIHRKNVQLWTQQTLELSMDLLGMMTSNEVIATGDPPSPQASFASQKAIPFAGVSDEEDD